MTNWDEQGDILVWRRGFDPGLTRDPCWRLLPRNDFQWVALGAAVDAVMGFRESHAKGGTHWLSQLPEAAAQRSAATVRLLALHARFCECFQVALQSLLLLRLLLPGLSGCLAWHSTCAGGTSELSLFGWALAPIPEFN